MQDKYSTDSADNPVQRAFTVRLGDVVDVEQGVSLEGVKQKRKPPPEFPFFIVVTGGPTLLRQKVPSVSAQALFYIIMERMQPFYKNTVTVHFEGLAEAFEVDVSAVYKQFKALLNADIFRKIRKGVYRVNPHIVWVGDTKKRKFAVQEWDHPEETP